MQYHINFDPRGNRFRNWEDSRAWRPTEGDAQWRYVMSNDYITKRANTLTMDPNWDDRGGRISEEMFDVDQLRDYR